MTNYLDDLVNRHHTEGVCLDTNILLLHVVGAVSRDAVTTFKRTRQFLPEDYDVAARFISLFAHVVVTPHILSEVSNLCGQLPDNSRTNAMRMLAQQIETFRETAVPANEINRSEEFLRFGLTDAAIAQIARRNMLVLTDDFRLAQYLADKGLATLNFNHIRLYGWQE